MCKRPLTDSLVGYQSGAVLALIRRAPRRTYLMNNISE